MTAIICWDTFQNQAGFITTLENLDDGDAALPVSNLIDYSTNTVADFTLGGGSTRIDIRINTANSTTVNYVAFAGHNIPTGTLVQVRDYEPPDMLPIFFQGNTPGPGPFIITGPESAASTGFVVSLTVPAFQAGSMFIGKTTTLPEGVKAPSTPPPLGRRTTMLPSIASKGSNFLGSHVQRVGWQFDIRQTLVDPAWVDANWLPMVRHIEQLPFFYLWDDSMPEDCMYAWADTITPPSYSNPIYMQWALKCSGLHVP